MSSTFVYNHEMTTSFASCEELAPQLGEQTNDSDVLNCEPNDITIQSKNIAKKINSHL